MKRNALRDPRLWIRNKIVAGFFPILFCCQSVFGTTLVVLVSGNAVVFGADGKDVDTKVQGSHFSPAGTGIIDKIAIIENRVLVSSMGVGRVSGIYDFSTWMKSLPIGNTTSVENAAAIIKKKAGILFKREWNWQVAHGRIPMTNLAGDRSVPWVSYYVGGNELSGPRVYIVEIPIDWVKNRLKNPTITSIYPPPKGITQYKNILVRRNGAKGGGMDQLFTKDSAVQRKYVKLYDREIGAAVYDEPLDVEGLMSLARILLTLEIETSPTRFSFPIKVCSITPGQEPGCKTYEQ